MVWSREVCDHAATFYCFRLGCLARESKPGHEWRKQDKENSFEDRTAPRDRAEVLDEHRGYIPD